MLRIGHAAELDTGLLSFIHPITVGRHVRSDLAVAERQRAGLLLFGAIYKVLPDVELTWRDVLVGAVVTALLFNLGKFLIGLYLAHSAMASSYGAAGALIIVLLWIYYSAQIFLLGAEFTKVYASRRGTTAAIRAVG